VIIPTYERREFVHTAVAGVLAQSYRAFELIVVDDGSTDGTAEELAPLSDRLRYIRQENRGTAAARNTGLAAAEGEIVAFLDSDDRWLPSHLEVITAILDRHPTAVLAGTCPGFLAEGREEPERAMLVRPLPRLLIANDVGYISSVAVRRSAVASAGGFGEGLEPGEYTDFVTRLALLGPFAMLRRRTVVPRATQGSLIDRGRSSGRYLDVLCDISTRAAEATRGGPDGERAEGARRFFDALSALNAGREGEAAEALREACRRYPELSSEPVLVGRQVINALPGERSETLAAIARLWPDQRSDTAGALRTYALAAAVRAGRGREATRLLRTLRPADARLIVERRGEAAAVVRRSLANLLHRGRESTLLVAR
jgi:hypothetical protein